VTIVIIVKVRKFLIDAALSLFGTTNVARGLEKQADELSTTPKSVGAMTSVYIPLIRNDFPEFNWPEFKQKAENMLHSAFSARNDQNIDLLVEASKDLKTQVSLEIQSKESKGEIEHFDDMVIHKTEINSYEKSKGVCIVTLQSAFQFYNYITKDGEILFGTDKRLVQTRYNIELIYVQDYNEAIKYDTDGGMQGLKCPNCGGTVTSLGVKVCPYCGTQVQEINIYVWNFNKYYEN
ncbi:MAG: zinc-ribbon domain-containing transport protein, partial [Oscillospiraceae bacterium]